MQIDQLPESVMNTIFSQLKREENIANLAACAAVSRKWNSILLNSSTRLVIDYYLQKVRWYRSNRFMVLDELCRPEIFVHLNAFPTIMLKELFFANPPPEFDVNKLNLFVNLERLELGTVVSVNLNLPHLQVLAIHPANKNSKLIINCPAMNDLFYWDSTSSGPNLSFIVHHPGSVQTLKTNKKFAEQMQSFPNVKLLIIEELSAIHANIFERLPNLTEIHYEKSMMLAVQEASGLKSF